MSKLKNTVVVFDLDDTLYKEIDYVHSGRRHVHALMPQASKKIAVEGLLEYPHHEDVWTILCNAMGLPDTMKESMLWAYRLHSPDITLTPEVKAYLSNLESKTHALAVITDGRLLTQELKLKALGLSHLPTYISEVWDGLKPAPGRFRAIEARWPMASYVYVGDNTAKDFVTPNQMGWLTVGLRDDGRNVHPQLRDGLSDDYLPKCWVNCITELLDVL